MSNRLTRTVTQKHQKILHGTFVSRCCRAQKLYRNHGIANNAMLCTLNIRITLGIFDDAVPCLRFQSHCQVPNKIRRRKPPISAAIGCSQTVSAQGTIAGRRSPLLGFQLPLVFRMAAEPNHRTAAYCRWLASQGLERLLALAITPPSENRTQED